MTAPIADTVWITHLLHRASQAADEVFAERVKAKITPRQAAVLAAITAAGEPSQAVLVAATGIDRSTMANIVLRMTRHGLVTRRRTRRDARRYAVTLTAKGREALDAAEDALEAIERDVLARVLPSHRDAFGRALRAVAEQPA